MKRRAFLRALLWALPVAPLAIKGMAQETPAPEPDFPEGYKTFVNIPNRTYWMNRETIYWSNAQDPNVWAPITYPEYRTYVTEWASGLSPDDWRRIAIAPHV
jgi:hypothetical protein